jgi:hypothetical protein
MTDVTMAFLEYLRKIGKEQDADFLREGIRVLLAALRMTLTIRRPVTGNLLHHSERGAAILPSREGDTGKPR